MDKLPRIIIAAPQSGSGKTTIVSGLIMALRKRGLTVQSFKVGPDYIDTGYHGTAGGRVAHNLDTWLTDRETMARLFVRQARGADISVVEGVMGLYDGGRRGVSSTSEIAKLLKIPVLLVIDAKSSGESAAAVALGFREYDRQTDIRGVILNRLGSESHKQMICEALERISMPVLGAVFRDESLRLPERHLGLLPREENNCMEIMEKICAAIEKSVDIDALMKIARSASELPMEKENENRLTTGIKIGVARDEAFSFYYPESLAVLQRLGAEIISFSPLRDSKIPPVSGLILGGGFPEIFAERLAFNKSMLESIRAAAGNGMPIYAECGGYLYLMRELSDFDGRTHRLAGVIPRWAVMRERLQTVGYVEATALADTVICPAGSVIRGHEFHFSEVDGEGSSADAAFRFRKNRTGAEYTGGYVSGNVLASYLHMHFAGAPDLAARFLANCEEYLLQSVKE